MNGTGHEVVTRLAFRCLRSLAPRLPILVSENDVAARAVNIDDERDLEFVNVDGSIISDARDNPHSDDGFFTNDDVPHYTELSTPLTTYSHFIDIGKGKGTIDDFDGYSYEHGSARHNQHQLAKDAIGSIWEELLITVIGGGKKVDEGLSWWFNDEYVHSPDKEWYNHCSPATERYATCVLFKSEPDQLPTECLNRFPTVVKALGERNHGIPYSTFNPIDNLGLHWWNEYEKTRNSAHLGPVLHAIHDATIPHHAGCHSGNWHGRYEKEVSDHMAVWCADYTFEKEVMDLFQKWFKDDPAPPKTLALPDRTNRVPARNWSIDMMVTWLALHAFVAYRDTYRYFADGYSFDEKVARDLTIKASAMSMVVLARAGNYVAAETVSGPVIQGTPHFARFGFEPAGETSHRTLTIKNTGKADLHVSEISLSGSTVFALRPIALPCTIAPGASVTLDVTYTAPRVVPNKAPVQLGRALTAKIEQLGGRADSVTRSLAELPSNSPKFRVYRGAVRVISDAQNTSSLKLYLEAGGLPLPREVDERMGKLRDIIKKGNVDTPQAAVALRRSMEDFDRLSKLWR